MASAASFELGPLRQVSLVAADVERALPFYRDSLGLPLLATFGALAFFDLGGTRLLLEAREREEMGGNSVLYFAVPDIHVARQALVARGVDFEDEPHLIHRDDAGIFGPAGEEEWMTFFRDTEGNLLALSSRERPGRA